MRPFLVGLVHVLQLKGPRWADLHAAHRNAMKAVGHLLSNPDHEFIKSVCEDALLSSHMLETLLQFVCYGDDSISCSAAKIVQRLSRAQPGRVLDAISLPWMQTLVQSLLFTCGKTKISICQSLSYLSELEDGCRLIDQSSAIER